jgi:hypothetical protein
MAYLAGFQDGFYNPGPCSVWDAGLPDPMLGWQQSINRWEGGTGFWTPVSDDWSAFDAQPNLNNGSFNSWPFMGEVKVMFNLPWKNATTATATKPATPAAPSLAFVY